MCERVRGSPHWSAFRGTERDKGEWRMYPEKQRKKHPTYSLRLWGLPALYLPLFPSLLLGKNQQRWAEESCLGNYFHNRKPHRMDSAWLSIIFGLCFFGNDFFGCLHYPNPGRVLCPVTIFYQYTVTVFYIVSYLMCPELSQG